MRPWPTSPERGGSLPLRSVVLPVGDGGKGNKGEGKGSVLHAQRNSSVEVFRRTSLGTALLVGARSTLLPASAMMMFGSACLCSSRIQALAFSSDCCDQHREHIKGGDKSQQGDRRFVRPSKRLASECSPVVSRRKRRLRNLRFGSTSGQGTCTSPGRQYPCAVGEVAMAVYVSTQWPTRTASILLQGMAEQVHRECH